MGKSSECQYLPLEQLAEQIYQQIARQFPVCCASDEFYFFPQVPGDGNDRWSWDDFSPARLETFAARSRQWEADLGLLMQNIPSHAERIDAELLRRMLKSLREQLLEISPQRSQPTFHLNIVVAGLTQALEDGDPDAWSSRIAGLPAFLQQAGRLLDQVPHAFLEPGRKMLADLELWITRLEQNGHTVGTGLAALGEFAQSLEKKSAGDSFAFPPALYERLVTDHLGCGGDLAVIERELNSEYTEMFELLTGEAGRLVPGQDWQLLEARIPFVEAPNGILLALYRSELLRLEAHVRGAGLVPDLAGTLQPELADVPAGMAAIRASDAYSARVGHPSRGGTFYFYQETRKGSGQVGRSLEYRITAAHETWPGHHLLDCCRWNLPRAIRRPLESPLCYEGWACFAETLLVETGYFDGPWDRFLLARRRLERAARGLIDLGMQTGRLTFTAAAELLVEAGYAPLAAANVVPKYALRPGYQVCYTLGLRRMLRLREQCRRLDAGDFARRVLQQGEIGFPALENVLLTQGD
jgi:uncharacterized protein (DUF885 family)